MAMVVLLLLPLILQHCSCSPIESDKELKLDQRNSSEYSILLKMNQIIETVNTFKLGWNGVVIKIETTKRDIINDFSQYLQYTEQEKVEGPYVPFHHGYNSPREKSEEDVRSMMSSVVENFASDISTGIDMIQNKMAVLQPLVELQLKMCKYCEKKIQWANQNILVVEKSLQNLMDKSQNGFQVITKMYENFRAYRLKIIKAKEQKLKNNICSNTDEYYKVLCEKFPNPKKDLEIDTFREEDMVTVPGKW
ncbi:uncharacterized protein LOC106668089 [Cimex lectularius]|uniref:Uncharacterized protein n=1 Tax=Cimex lectularius TaxID=79782 RepID=A0A8I6RUS7_CIMLE|nr:uncharacterized protein LOC106668089 [Cimex lectularius]